MTDPVLKHGLCFADLYDRDGLVRLDRAFVAHLAESDIGLHDRLMTARRDPDAIERLDESNLLVDLAPHLEDFVGELFGIEAEVRGLQARHHELTPLYSVKRLFVQRRAVKGVKEEDAVAIDGPGLAVELDRLMNAPDGEPIAAWERRYAEHVANWLDDEAGNAGPIETAQRYAPGRHWRPKAVASTGAAFCSRSRTGSTCTILCPSKPWSVTGSPCCGCPRTNGAAATALR
jgi:hypothetical protein